VCKCLLKIKYIDNIIVNEIINDLYQDYVPNVRINVLWYLKG